MPDFQSPEFVALFETYTSNPDSIGSHLSQARTEAAANDPLIVATATDLALYLGGGAPPSLQSFRLSTRGFKELASVSHLGPAVASLLNMHTLDQTSDRWRKDAERLLQSTLAARAANSTELWQDKIAVEAYRGREAAIAAMVDYGCALTARYLKAVLADESKLTLEFLQKEYLEAEGRAIGATVPFNAVMIATFFLTGLDIAFRITRWFKEQAIDWQRAMVLVCGKQGRPTGGVTWTSNSICQMILAASNHELPLDRMYVAPHASTFTVTDPHDLEPVKAAEEPLRLLWCSTRATSDLAPTMFDGFPRYAPEKQAMPTLDDHTTELSEMPQIASPDDMRAMTTRLRLVMEDPRQLLSGAVTDYAAQQLQMNGNNPQIVVVPGLDRYSYPTDL